MMNRLSRIPLLFVCCLALSNGVCQAQQESLQAYFAAQIWTGTGEAIPAGVLLVRDGMVAAVGPREEVVIPPTAIRVDLGEADLVPGLVMAETALHRGIPDGADTIAVDHLAWDGFDFYEDYHRLLASGITTVQVSPGANRLLPGQGCVVKLAGLRLERRTLRERESLRVILNSASRNPPRIYQPPIGAVSVDRPLNPTQPQPGRTLASAVTTLQLLFGTPPDGGEPLEESSRSLVETIGEYVHRGRTIRMSVREAEEIRAAMRLGKDFDLRLLLVGPEELKPFWTEFSTWQPHVRGVLLRPGVRPGSISESSLPNPLTPSPEKPWVHARHLLAAGLDVAFCPDSDNDLDDIWFLASLLQKGGLTVAQSLQTLTTGPAAMLGVDHRVGSLATGRDADFVVLSEPPFAAGSRVLSTYVDGERVYHSDETADTLIVHASSIHVGDGTIVTDGAVAIRGGKVVGIGPDVSAPPQAERHRYDGAVVVPGYLDLSTGLGLGGPLSGSVPLSTKLGEQLFGDDEAIPIARQSGVTSVLLTSSSGSPSPVIAFKLDSKATLIKDPVAVRFAISGNLTSAKESQRRVLAAGKAYADGWKSYEKQYAEYETKLAEYKTALAKYDAEQKKKAAEAAKKKAEEAKKQAEKKDDSTQPDKGEAKNDSSESRKDGKPEDSATEEKPKSDEAAAKQTDADAKPQEPKAPTKPKENAALEPYRALFAGEIPALVAVETAPEIELAVTLFRDQFQLRTILLGARDAYRLLPLLQEKNVAVAVGPTLVPTIDRERINLPQRLVTSGIAVAFRSASRTGVRDLPLAVQYSVHRGLGASDALAALTHEAARQLSLESQIGSLAVGRDADLVVLSGPPFAAATRVLAVMINGTWAYESTEQP